MEPSHKKPILAIIPAYNEADAIGRVVSGILATGQEVDIVVIDDGSTDGTGDLAREAGARVIRLSCNMGYGVAVQTGYKFAFEKGYGCVVQLDGDAQHDPAYLPKVIEPVLSGRADMVIGSRFLENAKEPHPLPNGYKASLIRRSGIFLFASVTSLLIGLKVTDPTSGYRAFNRGLIAFLVQDFFPDEYPDADVILMVHRAGFTIQEIPMHMSRRDTGESMYKGLKPVTYVFKMFLSILMNLLRKKPDFT